MPTKDRSKARESILSFIYETIAKSTDAKDLFTGAGEDLKKRIKEITHDFSRSTTISTELQSKIDACNQYFGKPAK